jgi:hypothetical protein
MKNVVLLGLLAHATWAHAQQDCAPQRPCAVTITTQKYDALTEKELAIQWEKMMIVTSGETEAGAVEHLRSHGMGEEGAKALRTFRAKAVAEEDAASRWLYPQICGRQEQIRERGGPEMLIQLMEHSSEKLATTRRRLLAEADHLLSPVDQERLQHLYTSDHGPKVGLTDSGVTDAIRTGKISVDQAIARACQLAKEQEGDAK